MPASDPGKRMIQRIKLAYENGKSVLWISQMSGLSTSDVMDIVKDIPVIPRDK